MANTLTTPASVASRLTDECIEMMADTIKYHDLTKTGKDKAAAVLRDYVRMRKTNRELVRCLKQAVGRFKDGQFCANTKCGSLGSSCSKCDAMAWRKVLAEAEKGEAK